MGCAGHGRYNVCAVAAESVTHTGPKRLVDQLHVLLKVMVDQLHVLLKVMMGCQLQSAYSTMTTPPEARDAVPQQQQHQSSPPLSSTARHRSLFNRVGGSGWRKSA